MTTANIVSALTAKQAQSMNKIEDLAKADREKARIMLNDLLARAFNAGARHSIRLQAASFGL